MPLAVPPFAPHSEGTRNVKRTVLLAAVILILAGNAPADTGDSHNLQLMARWPDGPCYGVVWENDIAYFGNGGSVVAADVSDPANPVQLGKVLVPGPVLGLDKSGDIVYAAAWTDGLRVIDVSDPAAPHELGHLPTPQYSYDVAVIGDYVYQADYPYGLRIIDVGNPANPIEVGGQCHMKS